MLSRRQAGEHAVANLPFMLTLLRAYFFVSQFGLHGQVANLPFMLTLLRSESMAHINPVKMLQNERLTSC